MVTWHQLIQSCCVNILPQRKYDFSNLLVICNGVMAKLNEENLTEDLCKFKFSFKQEPYLHVIKEQKYRIALSRLRASSHTLEIERGRHDRPQKPVDARLCSSCSVIEDERHFICECSINWEIRAYMFSKVNGMYLDFALLSDEDKFVFLMTNTDHRIINWLGKFVYQSFQIRDRLSSIVHTKVKMIHFCHELACLIYCF